MRPIRPLLGLLLLLAATSCVSADSIWARNSPRYANLFQDNLARSVGDVLTIVVSENTSINQREQRQLSKTSDASNNFSFEGESASGSGSLSGSASMDLKNASNRQFSGSAQLSSGRTYTDRIAVTVVDVLPNGVLLVEGRRVRWVSGERRVLRITGFVRPADVAPDNSIPSAVVADFSIEYVGRGVDSHFVNQGWLGRAFNFLWPF